MVNFGYPYNDIVICKDSTDYLPSRWHAQPLVCRKTKVTWDLLSSKKTGQSLCHNSFRNRAATLFNCLPKHIRNIVNCANRIMFKRTLPLDNHLCSIENSPMVPNECNSLNSRSKEKTMSDRWRAAIADQAE